MPAYLVRPERKDWAADHLRRYLDSNGEDGYYVDFSLIGGPPLTPTLILTTTGRRSGNPQTLPLIYGQVGKDFVIIASKGGAPDHPAWYLNLLKQPEVDIQIKSERRRVRGRTASGDERARLWAIMADIYPPYNKYQARTERQIPLVVLEPI
jgi:deazaflavin-dependent oxidoreductase (nitroreductase family)